VKTTIEFYEKLCDERPGAAFWSDNIVEASRTLTSHNNHANFYNYLSNPSNFKYKENIHTLGDFSDAELEKMTKEIENLSLNNQKIDIFTNGIEQTLIYSNMDVDVDEKCDT